MVDMKKSEAIAYFGGVGKLAAALGVHQSTVSCWREIPGLRQLHIQWLTSGRLQASPDVFANRRRSRAKPELISIE
jgi:DNA-binding transcriptional regulator Cro